MAECRWGDEVRLYDALVPRGYPVFPLSRKVQCINHRTKAFYQRTQQIFPGYVIVAGNPDLRVLAPRIPAKWIADADGNPVRMDDASVERITKLSAECVAGMHDLKLMGRRKVDLPPAGTRVFVKLLDRMGLVLRRVGHYLDVMVDGLYVAVRVSFDGFERVDVETV